MRSAGEQNPAVTERVHIERGSAGPEPGPHAADEVVDQCANYLADLEQETLTAILESLTHITQSRQRTESDSAFSHFTTILFPYAREGLASRAAFFARSHLVPQVLSVEAARSIEFHKGALFYNAALAHLLIGDEARFEYFLAMADEEDFRTHGVEGKTRQRGTTNLKQGELSQQTITASIRFGTDLLNGVFSSSPATYHFVLGRSMTEDRFDNWRRNLDGLHHAELFRFLNEAELFLGRGMPSYCAVLDNPYVMLRLVKSLAHAGQWIESRLTFHQQGLATGKITGNTLSKKLQDDPSFRSLVAAAGGNSQFAGNNPHGAAVDAELRTLLTGIASQTTDDEKDWRILRLFYIVRNSTAHEIVETLSFHADRAFLTELLQVVFIACFVIEKRKLGAAP
jgi:hypothetical protein